MSRRIVLVACVSTKLQERAKARDLYASPLFRLAFAYAKSLEPDRIFILSAKHGLLDPDTRIEPYDESLVGAKDGHIREWAKKVFTRLSRVSDPARDEYIFLAGERYRRHLAPLLSKVRVPAEGLGIGKQLQFFKRAHGVLV